MKRNIWQNIIRKAKFIFLFALLFMQISCGGLSYMAKNYDTVSSEDLQEWMRKTEFIYLHYGKDFKEIELLDVNKETGRFKFKIKGEIQSEQNYLYRHTVIGNNHTDEKGLLSLDQLHLYIPESKVKTDSLIFLTHEDIEKATRLIKDSKSQYSNPNKKSYTNPVLDSLSEEVVQQERKSNEDYDKYEFIELDYTKKKYFAGINFTNTFLINNHNKVSYTKNKYSPGFQAYIGVKAGKSFTKFRFQIGYEVAFNRYFHDVYTEQTIDDANNNGGYGSIYSIAVASNLQLGFFKIGLEAGKAHQFKADMGFGFGGTGININEAKSFLGVDDLVAFHYDSEYQPSSGNYTYSLNTSVTELSNFVFQYELSMGYSYNFNSGLYMDLSWILAVQMQYYGSNWNYFYSNSGYAYATKLNTGVFVGIGYQFGKIIPSAKRKQRFNSLRYR